MAARQRRGEKLLLIDTCGEASAVALCRGDRVEFVEELPERAASAGIVAAVRRLLQQSKMTLAELDGVGIVNGPGSFTGVRAGLAAAKGLCEAAALPLAAVSRLAVLAAAAGLRDGFAVLRAGRAELYVREQRENAAAREWLCAVDEFRQKAKGSDIVVAEARLVELLVELGPRLQSLHVEDALLLALLVLREGGSDAAIIDANYVRSESEIYCKGDVSKAGAGLR
jgi:tRNA threonylcarbamoyladenosine biosynthesis protein TsaB